MNLEELQRDVEKATGMMATVRRVEDGSYGAFVEINGKRLGGRSKSRECVVEIMERMVSEERVKEDSVS